MFLLATGWSANAVAEIDLVAENAAAPVSATAGDTLTFTYSASNSGSTLSYTAVAQVYLSPFPTVDITQQFPDYTMLDLDILYSINPGETLPRSRSVTLPDNVATGTYYIGAYVFTGEPESNTANNFSYQTIHITGTSCSDDSYESDNSAAAAKPLLFGQPQAHNHCNGTPDWIRFSAEAGKTYGISAGPVGSKAWVGLTLFDSSGSTVLATSSAPVWDFNAATITWSAPASGDYLIKVTPIHGLLSSGANTEYTLTLGDMRPDLLSESGGSPLSGVPGSYLYISESTRNLGFASAGPFDVGIYLSTDQTWSPEDMLLGTRRVPGLVVGEDSYSTYPDDSYTIPATITPGSYYILPVANYDNAISEYVTSNNVGSPMTLDVGAWDNCTPDGYEEDDAQPYANDLAVGYDGQLHNFCDDRTDWFRFQATAGTTYIIGGYGAQSGPDIVQTLYGPDGTTQLIESEARIRWTAPTTDTYYFKLYGAYHNGADSDYYAKVEHDLPELSMDINIPDPTMNAGGLINAWDSINNSGYSDSGSFKVSVYLSTDDVITRADTLLYQRSIDNLAPHEYYGSFSFDLPISRDLVPGTYYIGAIIDSDDQVPELREDNNLSTVHIVYITGNTCALDDYEDDDTIAQARSIVAEETQYRTTCDDGLDWVEFNAEANTTYLIEADGSVSEALVFAADGVTRQQTEAEYFYTRFSWRPSTAGKYYLQASTQHPDSLTVDYTLNVHACLIDAYEQDDTIANASLLVPDELQVHNYCDDYSDWYRFEAVAGMQYHFEAVNVGEQSNVLFSLLDTDGTTQLASSPWPAPKGNKPATITWVAPADGTYYLSSGDYHNWGKQREYTMIMTVTAPKGRKK